METSRTDGAETESTVSAEVVERTQILTNELRAAYDGLRTAADRFVEVEGRVNSFLDSSNAVSEDETVGEEFHELYWLWQRTPNASTLRRLFK